MQTDHDQVAIGGETAHSLPHKSQHKVEKEEEQEKQLEDVKLIVIYSTQGAEKMLVSIYGKNIEFRLFKFLKLSSRLLLYQLIPSKEILRLYINIKKINVLLTSNRHNKGTFFATGSKTVSC